MGKIHKDLKKAEKEYSVRKRQQLAAEIRRKPSQPKKKAYLLILAVFMTTIFGLYYFRTIITEYFADGTEVSGKFPRKIVTGNVPVNDPSRAANSDEAPGMRLPEFHKDVQQQLKVSSRPEPEPILSPRRSINSVQKKDQKREDRIARPLAETKSTEAPPKGADRPIISTKSDKNEPEYQSQNTQEPSDLKTAPHPNAKSEFFEESSMVPVLNTKPTVDDKEEPPDPGKLIDWLLKKRAMQNE